MAAVGDKSKVSRRKASRDGAPTCGERPGGRAGSVLVRRQDEQNQNAVTARTRIAPTSAAPTAMDRGGHHANRTTIHAIKATRIATRPRATML